MRKRYIFVGIVIVLVCFLVWRLSASYALYDQGYSGQNIVSGDKWGINIIEVSEPELTGEALVTKDISTIGTTLNFDVSLFHKGDSVSFDILVSNTSKLSGELYALTLSGLSLDDSEAISYSIIPVDYLLVHENLNEGSILKPNEEHLFHITVTYDNNTNSDKTYNLSLGSTIIYKQK